MAHVNLTFNSTEGVPSCPILLREVFARETFSSHADRLSTIFAVSINLIIMPLTIIFNAFVIVNPVKYASFRRERLMVLCFLALTDFSGLFCQPLYAAKEIYHLFYNQRNCGLESAFYHFSNISLLSSFFHLVLVTYERYVAILLPFKYPVHVTTPRLAGCAVGIWIGAIAISVLHYNYPFSEEELLFAQSTTALVCFLALLFEVYCYIRIGLVIRKQRMRIDAQIRQQQQRSPQFEQELQQRQLHRQKQQELQHARQQNQQRTRFQRRSSLSAFLLIICLIVVYLPFNICYGLASYYGDELRTSLFFSFLPWLEISVLLNSFFNPIIYCLRTREFRENLRMLLGCNM